MSTIVPKKRRNRKINPAKRVEESNTFVYKVTQFDENGWADATKYKPIPYDMIYLQTNYERVVKGWWAEFFFDGLRLKPDEIVVKWKKCASQWGWDE